MHWRSWFIPSTQNPLSSSILEFSEDRQGYLTSTLIFTYTTWSRQSNLLVWGLDNLMCQIRHSMWHTLEELVHSNHPKSAVIFNPRILRGSTGIPDFHFDFHMNKVQQAVKSITYEGQIIKCVKCVILCDMHWRVGLFQSPKTHCHLQSLNSTRIDKDTDSHFDFHIHHLQQAVKSISLRIR